jgi:hypothetical protein
LYSQISDPHYLVNADAGEPATCGDYVVGFYVATA